MNAQPDFTTAFQDESPNYRASNDSIFSLNVRRPQVRIAYSKSTWLEALEGRFNELTSLPRGWDGYVGLPVSSTCARFAANLIERLYIESLSPPQLVPMPDGTIRLEWHMNQFDLEIEVLGPYNVLAYRADLEAEEEDEMEIRSDFTELSNWVSDLASNRVELLELAGG